MSRLETRRLAAKPDGTAPDGTDVRLLLRLKGGSFAHFELPPGKISKAVAHRTVEEIWYFVGGEGKMWRKKGAHEKVVTVKPGVCLTIPLGTRFQFRSSGDVALEMVAVTMPPWPGEGEAYEVRGKWRPTIDR